MPWRPADDEAAAGMIGTREDAMERGE